MSELSIIPVGPGDIERLDAAYAIYRDAIVKSEQKTEAAFRALAARTDYRFLVAMRGEDVLGLAVSYAPDGEDVWLYEYAAVVEAHRGEGIGGQLFLASRLVAGGGRVALVEADADMGADEQARRLAFYSRLGFRQLAGLDYLLPLDAFGTPPPMLMLALLPAEITHVHVDDVERWLRRLYTDVYGRQLDDPRLATMIDPLPDDVPLDLI